MLVLTAVTQGYTILTGGRIPAFQVAGKLHNARQKIFCSNECPAAVFSRDYTAEAIKDRGYAWVVDGGDCKNPMDK